MKKKCCNCDFEDDEDTVFYEYHKRVYCYECLYTHFLEDGIAGSYFEDFLRSECEEIE